MGKKIFLFFVQTLFLSIFLIFYLNKSSVKINLSVYLLRKKIVAHVRRNNAGSARADGSSEEDSLQKKPMEEEMQLQIAGGTGRRICDDRRELPSV